MCKVLIARISLMVVAATDRAGLFLEEKKTILDTTIRLISWMKILQQRE
jgi:hypothetical protein